jgi:hypothetical protein
MVVICNYDMMQTYGYVNMMLWVCTFSTFMEMLVYTIICVLYHTNEWDISTNFWNIIVRSIKNVMAKKTFTINCGYEKLEY